MEVCFLLLNSAQELSKNSQGHGITNPKKIQKYN